MATRLERKVLKTEQGTKFDRDAVITDERELLEKLIAEKRRKWISAISREDLTEKKLSNDRVCSVHLILFLESLPKIGIDTIRTGYLL